MTIPAHRNRIVVDTVRGVVLSVRQQMPAAGRYGVILGFVGHIRKLVSG